MRTTEILEQLLSMVPDSYDTSAGSFFYDLLYPVAEYLNNLSETLLELEASAFAKTAVGHWLDYKTAEQGIERRAAGYASGTVRISGSAGAIINAGSLVASDDLIFTTDDTATIPEIGYIDITATCTTAGTAGNVGVGQIYRFPITLPGITAVYNPMTFTGGYAEETDEELRERYFEKVSRPNVSGNKYHYIEWAKEVSGVGDVQVIPLWNGPGTVKVVIVDTDGRPAQAELIAAVQTHIDECRPIGADVTVESAAAKVVNISAFIDTELSDFNALRANISAAVSAYLMNEATSKMYVSYAKVCAAIMSVEGVDDCLSLRFVNNSGDEFTSSFPVPEGSIPVLGELNLAENIELHIAI